MIIVYTALFGDSDSVKPAPAGADACVMFSDRTRPDAVAAGWDVRIWHLFNSARRDAWHIRCRPDAMLPEASQTVWVDASFVVTDLPALLRDAGEAELAGMRHPERASAYEEGLELVAIGQATVADVAPQLEGYEAEGYVATALTIAGVLVRRHTPAVLAFNALWDEEILKHAGDNTQLSLDYAAWKVGLPITHVQGVYTDNPYFTYDQADHTQRRAAYQAG